MEHIYLDSPIKTRWKRNNRIPMYIARCSGQPRAGVILLHGYTMDKEKLKYDALEIAEAGYLVLVPDLPLHGERALSDMDVFKYPYYGEPDGVVKLFENALADLKVCEGYLRTQVRSTTPLCLAGFSLGGCLTILAMARKPTAFAMGVSVVGSAHLSRLFFTSTITSDIRNDLISLGFNEETWRPLVRSIEATECSQDIHNLLLIGVEDDDIVPAALVRATYATMEQTTNECAIYETYGHSTLR